MVVQPLRLIDEFILEANRFLNFTIHATLIRHEHHPAPHIPPSLPQGKAAVYIFSLPANSVAPAGPNCVLKVGKVGANSAARFRYQHYGSSATSTLHNAINNNQILWSYIGNPPNVNLGQWMKQSLDRDSFFIDQHENQNQILDLLEVYLKGRLRPVYEGSLSL